MVSMSSIGICQSVLSQDKRPKHGRQSLRSPTIGSGPAMCWSATWKEPELTRKEILVRVDGKISFPLLGDIPAAGMTPMELTETIQKGLTDYVTVPL